MTFTSTSSVRNLVKILGTEPAADLLSTTVVAAIGPVTAAAATELDIEVTVVPGDLYDPGARGRDRRVFHQSSIFREGTSLMTCTCPTACGDSDEAPPCATWYARPR